MAARQVMSICWNMRPYRSLHRSRFSDNYFYPSGPRMVPHGQGRTGEHSRPSSLDFAWSFPFGEPMEISVRLSGIIYTHMTYTETIVSGDGYAP